MNCPCQLCKKHSETCHATCEGYKTYQEEHLAEKKQKDAYRKEYSYVPSFPTKPRRKPKDQVD